MENFSYWQVLFFAGVLVVVAALAWWRWMKPRKNTGRGLMQQRIDCYKDLPPLLNQYLDLADQLAHEYRFAFNHADRLPLESEETAEEIIRSLDQTETRIREKTNLLLLLNETELSGRINQFLLQEPNKRHSSPKDLEKYTVRAREEMHLLVTLLQQKMAAHS